MGEQFSMVICEECGAHTYYRVSVDATYVSGPTDRFYGIIGLVDGNAVELDRVIYLGVSTWQDYYVVYRVADYTVKVSSVLPNQITGEAIFKVICTP